MRWFVLSALLVGAASLHAGNTADETKTIAKLEKLGAKVSVDDEAEAGARLVVRFTRLDDFNGAQLRGLTNIGSLTIEDASRCTDKTLFAIATLPNLHVLNMWRGNISNSGVASLKPLKNLRELTLSDSKIGDSAVATFKDCAKLELVDVSGTLITNNAGLTFKTLPNLKTLCVAKTKFGDSGLASLKELKNLKEVLAKNTDISVKAAQALEESISGVRVQR